MSLRKINLRISLLLSIFILAVSCETEKVISDAQKYAALRNVTIIYDGMAYDIGLPPGPTGGQTLAELILTDSATYKNPANYSIGISLNVTVDNTNLGAEDAKFDGMGIDIVMDTLDSEPIQMVNDGFEVPKNETHPATLATTINLETHRKTGLYIFKQTVAGNDLSTTIYPYMEYDIGIYQGTLSLPPIHKDIPTQASAETKDFLRQLLKEGIFDE